MYENQYWQAVVEKNQQYDGVFVYGARSTKIYCRPSCCARLPKRENIVFFPNCITAESAGFRACKRCYPNKSCISEPHIELAQQICNFLTAQLNNPPTLDELAQKFNLSPYHLQRTFKRIVGISPKQYTEAQRLQRFKKELKEDVNVTEAIYEAGYISSSCVYEQVNSKLGMTPKNYQDNGKGMLISYTVVSSALGYLLVAMTEKGVCAVKLGDNVEKLELLLQAEFRRAEIQRDDTAHQEWIQAILAFIATEQPHLNLPLDIRGTAFQIQVWQALQKIPYGETRTYQDIAREVGTNAVRAVGSACGANPVALIIPCHRVLRSDGSLGGYEWGLERKQKLLELEKRKKGK
ncbi:methylated-DNA--protein-cysteine methyltransferase [Calothrix sp. NIES-4071]|nr:methylated-DNA--protein-cysteine methyltransferase [Calothrix sp. NIES-4071]BAZ57717.1 methylated-DNA--protein-cysteine methyltransferase [Calothrix sp. NIES-4105]